jgi:hypothetical protein
MAYLISRIRCNNIHIGILLHLILEIRSKICYTVVLSCCHNNPIGIEPTLAIVFNFPPPYHHKIDIQRSLSLISLEQ